MLTHKSRYRSAALLFRLAAATDTLQSNRARPLVATTLLYAGFIGASALAIGLLQLLGADSTSPWAMCRFISGGILAAASWRAGWRALDVAKPTRPSTREEAAARRKGERRDSYWFAGSGA